MSQFAEAIALCFIISRQIMRFVTFNSKNNFYLHFSRNSFLLCSFQLWQLCPAEARAATFQRPGIVHLSERHDPHPLFVRIPPLYDFTLVSYICCSMYKVKWQISVIITLNLLRFLGLDDERKKEQGARKQSRSQSQTAKRVTARDTWEAFTFVHDRHSLLVSSHFGETSAKHEESATGHLFHCCICHLHGFLRHTSLTSPSLFL